MKTIWKLKNSLAFLMVVSMLSFTGCKDGEDPDPRQAFVGSYEMDDFDVQVKTSTGSTDTTFSISQDATIEFELDDDLNPDELKAELEEFIEEVILNSLTPFSVTTLVVSADVDDDIVVEISNNSFEVDDHEYQVTLNNGGSTEIYTCEIEGDGELTGGALSFDFIITIFSPSATVTFEGEVEGEKE